MAMWKKTAPKAGALAMAAAMVMAMGTPALAADNYTAQAGTSTTFKKYLVMDSQANVPNVTFAYSIEPGSAITPNPGAAAATEAWLYGGTEYATQAEAEAAAVAAGGTAADVTHREASQGAAGNMAVLAGVGTPTIAANQAAFTPSDTLATTVAQGDNVELATGKGYTKKTVTIDFSSVSFPEPGVYRYLVKETSSGQQGISYDTQSEEKDKERVLDVYVTDNEGALVVSGYVMHDTVGNVALTPNMGSGDAAEEGEALDDKSDGFVNEYDTSDLEFKKEVAGNQASKDKVFKFHLAIANAGNGTVMTVVPSKATSNTNAATAAANAGKTNATVLTANADGAVEADFYLSHGDTILVKGLPKDAAYTLTEDAEDYKGEGAVVTGYTDPTNGTIASADLKTSYKNTRDGIIPTGIIISIAPYAAVAIAAGAGMTVIRKTSKREEDE